MSEQYNPSSISKPEFIEVPDWNARDVDNETAPDNSDQLAQGREVMVKRSSGEIEGGWKIVNNNVEVRHKSGRLEAAAVVEKVIDGESYTKTLTASEIMRLNTEQEPYAAAQQEMGGHALDALGVVEPTPETNYDYLFDPNRDFSQNDIEAASARPVLSEGELMARKRAQDDANIWHENIEKAKRR